MREKELPILLSLGASEIRLCDGPASVHTRKQSGESMKLILKFEKDSTVPVAWCEVCNKEITDAELAMVYWRMEDYTKGLHAPLLVHKRCMPGQRARQEDYECSMELSTYLAFLLKNVGLKLAKANRNAGLISTLRTP